MTSVFKVKKNVVVGVDIGSAFVKAVQLKKTSNGYSIVSAGISPIAENTIEDAKEREKHLLESVIQCLDSVEAQTVHAVTGISGPQVAVRSFHFPQLSKEEVRSAALLEASQVCPFNVEDAAVDYQVLGHDENGYTGILAAATKEAIEQKRNIIKHSSLSPVLMDVDGLALLNCFTQGAPYRGEPVALVNVGARQTNVVIVDSDGLPIVRDISIGGETLLELISTQGGFDRQTVFDKLFHEQPLEEEFAGSAGQESEPEETEPLESERGEKACDDGAEPLAGEDGESPTPDLMFALVDEARELQTPVPQEQAASISDTDTPPCQAAGPAPMPAEAGGETMTVSADFQSALSCACSNLFQEINSTIRYYGSGEISAEIEKVYLTGGLSSSRRFAELAAKQIASEVVLWDPTESYRCEGRDTRKTLEKYKSCFAVAIGLALRTF